MIKIITLSITTCYLVPIGSKYILIDTGYERDKKRFYKQLRKHGVAIKDISYIFITHAHDDHVGLLSEIIRNNQECKVILHKNAKQKLASGKNDMTKSSYINRRVAAVVGLLGNFSKGGFHPYKVQEKDIIITQEVTSFYEVGIDSPGRIIYTPGHTEDSISMILDNGICFCGDAAANMLSLLGTKNCIIVMEDLKKYYATWEKLLEEKITQIYPGHGKPFRIEKLRKKVNKNSKDYMRKVKM